MTRVDFHFGAPDKLQYACRLVRKIRRAGQQVVVFGDPLTLAEFDRLLWTFSKLDFIPHVFAGDALADRTPVILCSEAADTPHSDNLVNLSHATPPFFSRFERLFELVSTEERDRSQARERWRFYRDRGYPLAGHQLATG